MVHQPTLSTIDVETVYEEDSPSGDLRTSVEERAPFTVDRHKRPSQKLRTRFCSG